MKNNKKEYDFFITDEDAVIIQQNIEPDQGLQFGWYVGTMLGKDDYTAEQIRSAMENAIKVFKNKNNNPCVCDNCSEKCNEKK
jgi:hypothetical protein